MFCPFAIYDDRKSKVSEAWPNVIRNIHMPYVSIECTKSGQTQRSQITQKNTATDYIDT
jgi:hypothetical protein